MRYLKLGMSSLFKKNKTKQKQKQKHKAIWSKLSKKPKNGIFFADIDCFFNELLIKTVFCTVFNLKIVDNFEMFNFV